MIRPYENADFERLWPLKRRFELALGESTGGEGKAAAYREKLDDDYRRRYRAWVDRCVDADDRCVLLAERAGEPIGYAFVLPEELTMIWDAAVLNELFVASEFRGTGIADELVAEALAVARAQDPPLDRLVLDVDPGNERARRFYDRHGFEPWGEMVGRPL